MSTERSNGAITRNRTRIQAVSRASLLLRLVASRQTDGSVTALAASAGLAVPTSHHLLSTLCADGLLARDQHGRYILGPTVAVLADALDRELAPAAPLLSSLHTMTRATEETCYLALWRGGGVHIAATALGTHPIQVAVPSIPYRDTVARATGRVFLAHLPPDIRDAYLAEHPLRKLTKNTIASRRKYLSVLDEIKRVGYAVDHEEFQERVCCVSAAVVIDGTAIAALSVSVPRDRWDENSASLIQVALSAADAAARGLLGAALDTEESA